MYNVVILFFSTIPVYYALLLTLSAFYGQRVRMSVFCTRY